MRGNCGAAHIRRGEEALWRYATAPPTSQDAAAAANLTAAPGLAVGPGTPVARSASADRQP